MDSTTSLLWMKAPALVLPEVLQLTQSTFTYFTLSSLFTYQATTRERIGKEEAEHVHSKGPLLRQS